jgi:ferrochelatase
VVENGDPYPSELRGTALAVASELGLVEGAQWETAWQSAGRTPEPWLTPDVLTVIDRLGADPEVEGVVVCACGFVSDHLEVLYDLDIDARRRADDAGLRFDRTRCVNDDHAVMAALADRIAAV